MKMISLLLMLALSPWAALVASQAAAQSSVADILEAEDQTQQAQSKAARDARFKAEEKAMQKTSTNS